MNTEAVRLKLINWISQIEDEKLLSKIESLLNQNDVWNNLSYADRQVIDEGLQQLNEGESILYSDFRKEIDSLLNTEK